MRTDLLTLQFESCFIKAMKKELARVIFSGLFLFIFFVKMVISIAPLIVKHCDKKSINAVIMQLEIENNTKESDQAKEKVEKDYVNPLKFLVLDSRFTQSLESKTPTFNDMGHKQSFYPAVPTPPPNC